MSNLQNKVNRKGNHAPLDLHKAHRTQQTNHSKQQTNPKQDRQLKPLLDLTSRSDRANAASPVNLRPIPNTSNTVSTTNTSNTSKYPAGEQTRVNNKPAEFGTRELSGRASFQLSTTKSDVELRCALTSIFARVALLFAFCRSSISLSDSESKNDLLEFNMYPSSMVTTRRHRD